MECNFIIPSMSNGEVFGLFHMHLTNDSIHVIDIRPFFSNGFPLNTKSNRLELYNYIMSEIGKVVEDQTVNPMHIDSKLYDTYRKWRFPQTMGYMRE